MLQRTYHFAFWVLVSALVHAGCRPSKPVAPAPERERAASGDASARGQLDARDDRPTPALATATAEVRWVGAMRDVRMKGDLTGHIDLESLADLPHLYAVGPVEGLRGEVTIADGVSLISGVRDGKALVDRTFGRKACFLVYAQVERWHELPVPESVGTSADLEEYVWRAASERLDVSKPFPFLLKGKPAKVDYHIMNKTDDAPHTPEEHEQIKVRFQLAAQPVEIVGFCSDKHQGVFTHHDSKVHMHVRTLDGTTGGHVDALHLSGGITLYLPKTE